MCGSNYNQLNDEICCELDIRSTWRPDNKGSWGVLRDEGHRRLVKANVRPPGLNASQEIAKKMQNIAK